MRKVKYAEESEKKYVNGIGIKKKNPETCINTKYQGLVSGEGGSYLRLFHT